MIWLTIIAGIFLVALGLFLFLPIKLEIDTRIPILVLRWTGMGKAVMCYEKESWLIHLNLWHFHREWTMEELIFAVKKPSKKRKKKKVKVVENIQKGFRVIKSFRITTCILAIDCGDPVLTAWMYPINFFPSLSDHVSINFRGDNYMVAAVTGAPWRIMYALIS